MDARNCFFGFQIVSGVSNKPFPTYFGAVTAAEHVLENVLKCFKIIIFKLENRISMINSRSERIYDNQISRRLKPNLHTSRVYDLCL